jgi:hypothetical protein
VDEFVYAPVLLWLARRNIKGRPLWSKDLGAWLKPSRKEHPFMTGTKYIGMDVHKENISIAVRNDVGKLVMECVIETKANVILDFIHGLRGELQVTFEEGTWATWCKALPLHYLYYLNN